MMNGRHIDFPQLRRDSKVCSGKLRDAGKLLLVEYRDRVPADQGNHLEVPELAEGTADGFGVLERLNPDYVWLKAESGATAEWLRAHGYREDVRTDRSFIAVRGDLPRLSPWPGTPSGCFPGP